MVRHFTLKYWLDGGWYVGRLKEVPGVFSQGKTMKELEENIQETYKLMMDDESSLPDSEILSREIEVDI